MADDEVSLLEGMATTRAIRRFRPDPIPEDDLATMLWHASRAPSGSNRQPFRFLVLRDGPRAARARSLLGESFRAEWATKRAADGYDSGSGGDRSSRKARMASAMQQFVDRFEQTPVVVLACHEPYRALTPFDGANVYPACQNLLLAARALGYGGVITMWHVLVDTDLREALGIPANVFIAATIGLGRPEGSQGAVRRRPLDEIVYEDEWGEPAAWAVDPPGTRFAGGPRRGK
ncbi:MAG TPA: nitroreductase family protein [Acidimicrobiales bacterium]